MNAIQLKTWILASSKYYRFMIAFTFCNFIIFGIIIKYQCLLSYYMGKKWAAKTTKIWF
jgi:hypothetical protein